MSARHLSAGSRLPLGKGRIRLYTNRYCPYAQRVHLVLDAKKLLYEPVYINLLNRPDWFFQKSPNGKVPALELENGDIIYESIIIANYLDDKYPQHALHRKDPLQKAKDSLLIHQFNKVISSMNKVLLASGKWHDDQELSIKEGLDVFEGELNKRGRFYGGQRAGMVDYMIWPWVERADLLKLFDHRFTLKKDKYPRLLEWKKTMVEDPAVKKTYLTPDMHTKFLQSYRAGVPDYDILTSQL